MLSPVKIETALKADLTTVKEESLWMETTQYRDRSEENPGNIRTWALKDEDRSYQN